MAEFVIDYELRKNRDYQKLYAALNNLHAKRILESTFHLVHPNTNVVALREYFKAFIDPDDGIFVVQIVAGAGFNVLGKPGNF